MRGLPFFKAKNKPQFAGLNFSDGGGGGGSLAPATASTLGGVKIGSGVNVTSDGTISVSAGGIIFSSTERECGVDYDGAKLYTKTIIVDKRSGSGEIGFDENLGNIQGDVLVYGGYIINNNDGSKRPYGYAEEYYRTNIKQASNGDILVNSGVSSKYARADLVYRKS